MAVIVYIHRFDSFCMSKHSRTLSGGSVNEISCYCPGGSGVNILYIIGYNGCHILVYGCLQSGATYITEAAQPKITDALVTGIFKMWYGAFRLLVLL